MPTGRHFQSDFSLIIKFEGGVTTKAIPFSEFKRAIDAKPLNIEGLFADQHVEADEAYRA